ncbi:MAG TPA: DMT family transporter, partial [Nevskiaceae bacterium]|nr:DMT family transporter [Nevskiaceae bacterium]
AFWHVSIGVTSVANATLLANVAPVFVAAAAWLLFRERITAGFLAGLVLALAGAGILVGHSASLSSETAFGDGLAVIAAVFYAGYLMTVSHLRRAQSTLTVMAWTSFVVAVSLLGVALLLGERIWPSSLQGWLVLVGLALLSHIGGQGLIAYALAHLPTSFSAVGLLVQPLAAAVFAWSLLREPFGWQQAIGGLVVLAGITLCRLSGERVRATSDPSDPAASTR